MKTVLRNIFQLQMAACHAQESNPGSIALLGQFWEKIAGLGPWDPVCIPKLG